MKPLAVAWVISAALWPISHVSADEAAASAAAQDACADDDAKWAAYNSSCAQMEWLCSNDGYGTLVRKWCPRTCGLCSPPPFEIASKANNDAVVLIDGRPVLVAKTELEQSAAKNEQNSTAQKQQTNVSEAKANFRVPDLEHARDKNRSQELVLSGKDYGKHDEEPMVYEITLPLNDGLVHVLSKKALVPRALWSTDQEHFVFEVNDDSQNISISSESLSTEVLAKGNLANAGALQALDDASCPKGYSQVDGHIYGGDQFGRGYMLFAPSIRECARWCTQEPGCGSFSYSGQKKHCLRHSQTRPTSLSGRLGFMLCRRTPCPSLKTEAACMGPSMAATWHSSDVRLRPGGYCIWSDGVCQAPMACTSQNCFLPDGGFPGMQLPIGKTLMMPRATMLSTMAPARALPESLKADKVARQSLLLERLKAFPSQEEKHE